MKEREDYIKAVQCLQSLPPKTSTSEVPGVRSRFDDFLAVHVQQTDSIHGTVRLEVSKLMKNPCLFSLTGQLPLVAPILRLDL